MQTVQPNLRPSIGKLFLIWTKIGLQSFGGSTLLLIQREFIHKRHWLTLEECALLWNQCIFTPGINLVALTILIGRKLGGVRGIAVSLAGMLIPSSIITCLLTMGFSLIQHQPAVQATLKGVIPATAGFLLVIGLSFAQPQVKLAYHEGWLPLIASLAIVVASAAALMIFNISIMLVIPGAALLGMLIFTKWGRGAKAAPASGQQHEKAGRP